MDAAIEFEEKLRECACTGDLDTIRRLVERQNIDINAQNKMNGWTALHWASKRNNKAVVSYLMSKGSNASLTSKDGDLPANLTSDEDIKLILGGNTSIETKDSCLPIVPNYISHPPFPYTHPPGSVPMETREHQGQQTTRLHTQNPEESELVVKIRLANSDERDFLEVELDKLNLTFEALLSLMCRELAVDRKLVQKIRKLPDTIVRKDKDVKRLRDLQELELVLTNKAISSASRNYGNISNGVRNEQILY